MLSPLLEFSHQPIYSDVDTAVTVLRVQQPIISKWALLDIWQHLGSYTQLPPLLLSLSAQRLNTEKSRSFIFKGRSHVSQAISLFLIFFCGSVQLCRLLLDLNVGVSFKQTQIL